MLRQMGVIRMLSIKMNFYLKINADPIMHSIQ